jgi:hypothetical protein
MQLSDARVFSQSCGITRTRKSRIKKLKLRFHISFSSREGY